jgi:hypothetical protein
MCLGKMYRKTRGPEQGRAELTMAIRLDRAMEMSFRPYEEMRLHKL